MKIIFTLLFFSMNIHAQNLAGYTFTPGEKKTPFTLQLSPFATDGCTRYHDGTKENPTLWQDCCIQHDLKYWLGGTSNERKQADEELYECVKNKGEPGTARVMYLGTRAGGGPLGNNTYRWGFGWNRVRNYGPLTSAEKEMAYEMYGDNLENLKKDIAENKYIVKVPDSYELISPFPYTFCEESVINYLAPKLSHTATVTKSDAYQIGETYNVRIHLDICDDPIEFEFNKKTDSRTCKRDYAYSTVYNRISHVNISKECSKKL